MAEVIAFPERDLEPAAATIALVEPAPLADAAFYGLAGAIVRRIEPHTEADAGAMLIQLLVAFGNCVGRGSHFRVEDTEHYANEFVVIVGRSSKARKGTSFNRTVGLFDTADANWRRDCQGHGLVSGEGIVHAIRDEALGKKEGEIIADISDKRLLIVEEEFGGTLSSAARRENTLTATLRSAWDSKDLRTLAKNSHERVTAPHISLIGHITIEELKAKLRGDALSNGFANRFLWIYATRSRLLPDGGKLRASDLHREAEMMRSAVAAARGLGELTRDSETAQLWRDAYGRLSGERPGLAGHVTSRMEAHAVRLMLIYALLDGSRVIKAAHLRAALAVCEYGLRSAEHCFGGLSSDARAILATLFKRHPGEMTRSEITRDVFSGHKAAETLAAALTELEAGGHATRRVEPTAGASREVWRHAKKAN